MWATWATCPDCGKVMSPGTPCDWAFIQHPVTKELHRRDTGNICGAAVCPDCNAPLGKPHHFGCDNERCPICGDQIIGCDCWGQDGNVVLVKETK